MAGPEITVAIPSHARLGRLLTLLEGLDQQSLARARFEVVVCHDYPEREATSLDGAVEQVRIRPGAGGPAIQRNRAWRTGTAPLVAFIDDDCRPAPGWLDGLLQAAHANPEAIVEGRTRPDPDEAHLLGRAHARSLLVDPPSAFGQTCNIMYPRSLLERLDGFDEQFPMAAGEDTDLIYRARDLGARHVGAPEALVWHAVDPGSLRGRLRSLRRWQYAALVARRHPGVRSQFTLGIFLRPGHLRLLPALLGLVLAAATRRPHWLALMLPWLRLRGRRYGLTPRGVGAASRDTAGRFLIDTVELGVMVQGSLRFRTLVL